MNNMNYAQLYRENDIKTASPIRIVIMLYDEAIKQLDIAQGLLQEHLPSYDAVNNAIGKAQDIITELLVSLDMDKGGEIAENLSRLYFYFNRVLGEANIKKQNTKELPIVRNLLAELRDAWRQISATNIGDHQPPKGIDVLG